MIIGNVSVAGNQDITVISEESLTTGVMMMKIQPDIICINYI